MTTSLWFILFTSCHFPSIQLLLLLLSHIIRQSTQIITADINIQTERSLFFLGFGGVRSPLHTKQQVSWTATGEGQVIGWHVFRPQKMFPFWEKEEWDRIHLQVRAPGSEDLMFFRLRETNDTTQCLLRSIILETHQHKCEETSRLF